ncbi:sulfatase-like hydrolase/transferase [Photobacterium sagamiensis]|uniref:sulfatase-like hydrolase/transferase n=1 Tax=Photobacterium sagamiensis TaxID=2910241 RepID=UPI003D0AC4D7
MFEPKKALEVVKRHKVKTAVAIAVAAVISQPIIKLATYSVDINPVHLAKKQEYLSNIEAQQPELQKLERPNIVLMVLDDMGYSDLSSYGSKAIKTPNIDKLAEYGLRFTNYYTGASSSTPSRAAMMTGRYPIRNGLAGVVWPSDHPIININKFYDLNTYLPTDEVVIAEPMKAAGYSTAMIGKWHLGDVKDARPHNMGFEQFYGALYSNDMDPFEIYDKDDIAIPAPVDQTKLNDAYFDKASEYIESFDDNKPFFMYFAHSFPHVPLFVPEEELGKSDAGLYGDVMSDIDNSVGEMIEKLKAEGKYENTIFIITSDNGPWFDGDAGDARGRKFESFDGGQRVPFIVSWPDKIKEGKVIDSLLNGVDVFPTLLSYAGIDVPQDRRMDGLDIASLFAGDEEAYREQYGERFIYYYGGKVIEGVRGDRFKYRGEVGIYSNDMSKTVSIKQMRPSHLYDYEYDTREAYDVTEKHPEAAANMKAILDKENVELAANPRGWID